LSNQLNKTKGITTIILGALKPIALNI